MSENNVSVSHPFIKAGTSLAAGLGVSSWSEFAALLATIYTGCLLAEWWWKRFWRPALERRGWLRARLRRKSDRTVRQRGMARPRMLVAVLSVSGAFVGTLVGWENYTSTAVIPVPGDVPTVGFGTTGPDVKMGATTTPPKAIQRLLRDVAKDEAVIKNCVLAPLSQGEYDASVLLAYNIGAPAFCDSTIVKKFNAHDYAAACGHFMDYVCGPSDALHAAKPGERCYSTKKPMRVIQGLVNRRADERATCEAT